MPFDTARFYHKRVTETRYATVLHTYSTAIRKKKRNNILNPQKIPDLVFIGELSNTHCAYFEDNWLCYQGTAQYRPEFYSYYKMWSILWYATWIIYSYIIIFNEEINIYDKRIIRQRAYGKSDIQRNNTQETLLVIQFCYPKGTDLNITSHVILKQKVRCKEYNR